MRIKAWTLPLYATENSGKNWKCPELGEDEYLTQINISNLRNFNNPEKPRPPYWKWFLQIGFGVFTIIFSYMFYIKRRWNMRDIVMMSLFDTLCFFFVIFLLTDIVLMIITYFNMKKVKKDSDSDKLRFEEEKKR